MKSSIAFRIIGVSLAVLSAAGVGIAQRGSAPALLPGAHGGGTTLLPNGWRIAPAGRHLAVGDFPMNMVLSPDGHHLIVTNNGYDKPSLRVVDVEHGVVSSTVPLDDAWLGLAWHPDGKRLYSSAAAANAVQEIAWQPSGRLTVGRSFMLGAQGPQPAPVPQAPPARGAAPAPGPAPIRPVRPQAAAQQTFIGGVAVSVDGTTLAAVQVFGKKVQLVDVATGDVRATASLAAEPYTCLFSADGTTLFVSLWGGARVLFFDAKTLAPKGEVIVGEHPNAILASADGKRLFVACANTNAMWVVDVATMKATEQVSISLFPNAPPGSTPNALAISPSGQQLLVANADNNSVAVIDISNPGQDRVAGFIPTGWYPTSVLFSRDGKTIYILSGKGLTSMANPRGPQPGSVQGAGQYSGSMLEGSLSLVATPDDAMLAKYTKTVHDVTPYTDASRLSPLSAPAASSIPRRVGDPSPIKHVFYIIRENRSYDQILGDLDRGNGDPTLTLFGEDVTPNAHALAREFVTFDNFYVNAEVSYSGHAFSTAAYANDAVEKIWPTNYGSRGGPYLSEGGGEMRNAYGNLDAPMNGYIWDSCNRANVSVRSYGEFVAIDAAAVPSQAPGRGEPDAAASAARRPVKASVPGLVGRIHPNYPPFDLKIQDQQRADIWLEEFQKFEAAGTLPALSIIRLGNDHTNGTRAGSPSPRAMIADNDLALGRIIEAISRSKDWNTSAVFVLEDDSQNGPDHVDAHRSPVFVASPYTLRGAVDSTLYTTSGVLRTMELILGLPPMSQYDAAATPMYHAFSTNATLTPFTHRDARISLGEVNTTSTYGAAASALMNFDVEDRIPEDELNLILWRSVKGPLSVMPPPVHAAFVRKPLGRVGDDDDDDDRIR